MALALRTIPAVPDITVGTTKPYQFRDTAKRDVVLRNANHNTMVGALSQLAALADIANQMFTNLAQEATQTFTRTVRLTEKLSRVYQIAVEVEQTQLQMPLEQLLVQPRVEFSQPPIGDVNLFTAETLPAALKDQYNAASPPPNLSKMDAYMDGQGKCIELYTNPKFFLNEWIAEQMKQRQAAKDAVRKRRADKQTNKTQEDAKVRNQLTAAQPKRVAKDVFDPLTGQRIAHREITDTKSELNLQSTMKKTSPVPELRTAATIANIPVQTPSPPPLPPSLPYTTSITVPGDLDDSLGQLPTEEFSPPPPPADDFVPPPPPPRGADMLPVPPPPAALPEIRQAPIFVNQTQIIEERKASFGAAPAAPPAPVYVPPAPGIQGFVLTTSPSSGNFLSELQNKGVSGLKAAGPAPSKVVDVRSNLLQNIKSGVSLKSAKERAVPEVQAKEVVPTSVAEILARRIAIQGSDSEDEDGEDDAWDD